MLAIKENTFPFVLILWSQPRGQRIIETSSLDLMIPRGRRVDGLMKESEKFNGSSSGGEVEMHPCSGLSLFPVLWLDE